MITTHQSSDGLYQYASTEVIDQDNPRRILYVGFNPSPIAHDDGNRTCYMMRRIATAHGYGEFAVVNLYAYRAISKHFIEQAALQSIDVIGPENNATIEQYLGCYGDVALCWGSTTARDDVRVRWMFDMLWGRLVRCVGVTSTADPHHPLYSHGRLELYDWQPRDRLAATRSYGHRMRYGHRS